MSGGARCANLTRLTHPRLHPQRIEYIRPPEPPRVDPARVGLWKLWHLPHVAYRVDDLEEALRGEEVILGPFEPGDFGAVAFVHKDGAVIEYLQYTTLERWGAGGEPALAAAAAGEQ